MCKWGAGIGLIAPRDSRGAQGTLEMISEIGFGNVVAAQLKDRHAYAWPILLPCYQLVPLRKLGKHALGSPNTQNLWHIFYKS